MTKEYQSEWEQFYDKLPGGLIGVYSRDEIWKMYEGWKLARKAQAWQPFDNTITGVFLVRVPNSRNGIQVANFSEKINTIGHRFDFDFETPDLMASIPELPK